MPLDTTRPRRALTSLRRAVLRRRRLLAAVLTAVAVAAGLSATTAKPPGTVPVLVASRPLPAGEVLGGDDLVTARFAPGSAPDDLAAEPTGRVLAAPVTRGEPVTEARLVGPALTAGRPDLRAVPLRLPDAGAVALLRVGDLVDLVAADPQSGEAATVATDVVVLSVPAAEETDGATGLPGRLMVAGVAPGDVPEVADAVSRLLVTYVWSSH